MVPVRVGLLLAVLMVITVEAWCQMLIGSLHSSVVSLI